jgi:hypothetical protein
VVSFDSHNALYATNKDREGDPIEDMDSLKNTPPGADELWSLATVKDD